MVAANGPNDIQANVDGSEWKCGWMLMTEVNIVVG
jgi:hypothetical protein